MNIGTLFATTMLNAGNALFNGGTLIFYSGSAPATPETAPTGTALVTFTFSATAFAAPALSGGYEGAAAAFTSTSANPVANGTVGYARATESNGTTYICDYTVGTSATDIIIGNTGIQVGVPVTISSFQNRIPAL
nr:hypothetical protein [uncultured Lichenicoccus sp.]